MMSDTCTKGIHTVECPLCASPNNSTHLLRWGPYDFEAFVRCDACGAEVGGAQHGRTKAEASLYAAVLWNTREVRECRFEPVVLESGRRVGQRCAECGYLSTVEVERDEFMYCPGCGSLIVGRGSEGVDE